MKKQSILAMSFIALMTISHTSVSQTKKEKKIETKSINIDMYSDTESKEAKEYYTKAYAFGEQKDYKNAIKWYKKCLEADPKFVEAYDNLGAAYRRSGDIENAKKNYLKSIELYPQGSMAHQNLGIVYVIEKDYTKALEQYSIMQKNDSTDAEAYYGTIQIYFALKNYKSAVKSSAKTLEIYEATNSPYVGDAQYMLGLSYYYDNDDKNAKIYLQQAKKSGVAISESIVKEFDLK